MGILSALFGGKTTNENEVHMPAELTAALNQAMAQGQSAFGQGFTPYTGQAIANFSGDELAGFDLTRAFANPQNSLGYRAEQQGLNRLMGPASSADLEGYMNPFISDVLDRTTQRMSKDLNQQLSSIRARNLGAAGGSRQAVLENEARDSYAQAMGDLQYRGRADAFDRANDRYYGNAAQAFGMGLQSQGQELNRANALLGIGGAQRALSQAGLDFDRSEFMRGINEPKQDALSLMQLAGSYNPGFLSSTQTQTKTPGLLNAIGGLAGSVLGIPGVGSALGLGGGSAAASGLSSGMSGGFAGYTPQFNYGGQFPYATNPFNPGYKDGGVVKKYADGGFVNRFYDDPNDFYDSGFAKLFGLKSPSAKIMDQMQRSLLPEDDSDTMRPIRKDLLDMVDGSFPKRREPEKTAAYQRPRNPFAPEKSVPAPSLKPTKPSEVAAIGMDMINNPTEVTQSKPEDDRNFYERWQDNPWTQFGLQMLAGMDNDTGRSARGILETRQAEIAEEQRQREDQRDFEQRQQQNQQDQQFRQENLELEREKLANDQAYREQQLALRLRELNEVKAQAQSDRRFGVVGDIYERAMQEYTKTMNAMNTDELTMSPEQRKILSTRLVQLESEMNNAREQMSELAGINLDYQPRKRYNPATGTFE